GIGQVKVIRNAGGIERSLNRNGHVHQACDLRYAAPTCERIMRMQAVMCEAYGGPESLVVKTVDSPSPGPGEVKIRLRARGVSYTDVLRVAGQYHVKATPPVIPSGEAA